MVFYKQVPLTMIFTNREYKNLQIKRIFITIIILTVKQDWFKFNLDKFDNKYCQR